MTVKELAHRESTQKLLREYEWEVGWRQKRIEELMAALQDHVHEPQSNYAFPDTCTICGIITEGL